MRFVVRVDISQALSGPRMGAAFPPRSRFRPPVVALLDPPLAVLFAAWRKVPVLSHGRDNSIHSNPDQNTDPPRVRSCSWSWPSLHIAFLNRYVGFRRHFRHPLDPTAVVLWYGVIDPASFDHGGWTSTVFKPCSSGLNASAKSPRQSLSLLSLRCSPLPSVLLSSPSSPLRLPSPPPPACPSRPPLPTLMSMDCRT